MPDAPKYHYNVPNIFWEVYKSPKLLIFFKQSEIAELFYVYPKPLKIVLEASKSYQGPL